MVFELTDELVDSIISALENQEQQFAVDASSGRLVEIKDILGNRFVLKLSKEMGTYKYYLKIGRSKGYEGDLDFDFWKDLSNILFVECSFHKWNETYFGSFSNYGVVWDIEASFERRHTLSVHGCNSFPVYWKRVVASILPLIEECEGFDTFIHSLLKKEID